jgi:hypothetical protein
MEHDVCPVRPPFMLQLHYSNDIGMLTMRPLAHTHPCVTFTEAAAKYCGGAIEHDDDGYIVRCADEVLFADTARALLRMLPAYDSYATMRQSDG